MAPNDKLLPEETYNKVLGDAVAYDKERKMQVAYYDGATAWAGWKVRFDELQAENEKLNKRCHELMAQPGAAHIHKDTVEENWESFWKPIVTNEDGTINIKQIKKELHDFSFIMEQVPRVYCHITGNRMSKVMYHADTVISVADDYFQEQLDEAVKDEKGETSAPLTQARADLIREANNRDMEGVVGREEDVEKSQFDNWHRWISEQGYTYDGEFYYDEDLNYYTPDQLWGMFK